MKKVTLLVASVLCALGSYAQSQYNTTTKYFTAPELRAEADATGKALIGINNVTSTGDKYINGEVAAERASADGTLEGVRVPYDNEVLEMIPADGGYILRRADAAEGEGYFSLSGNNFALTGSDNAVVWTVLGPGEDGYGNVSGYDDLYTDIDHSLNENMVRFVYNGNQYMNGQGFGNVGGVRGGTGAWSFNYIYNANYGKTVEPVDPEPPVVVDPVEYGPVLLSAGDNLVNYKIHNLGADDGSYKGNDCYVKYVAESAGTWNSLFHTDSAEDADNFAFFAAEDGGVFIKDVTANKFVTWKQNAEGGINWGSHQLTACQVTLVDAMADAKSWFIVDDENTEGRYDILPLETANNGWSFMGGIDQDFVVLNLEKKTDRNIKWVFEQVEEETPVDPEPPVVEGPQAAFTLTNLSSTADNYSFPIEVPAEFAAPVLEAKATTTVIEFVKTAGNKAAFVASTDGGNNFYANITLADNRIGFDYMMDNGAEGWFTKTQAPYTNLNTTVRIALTQDEESGLLNWYDAETGQQINSTNVSTNSAWGSRSFGSKGYSHLYVGGYLDAAGNAQYVFPGEIASVRVYPQLLTTDEMTSLTWEGLEDSFDYIPETPVEPEPEYNYAEEVAPVLAEANAALEGHDHVYNYNYTYGDALLTEASQFSSPFSQNDLGGKDGQNLSDGCLIDNDNNTFWHSYWGGGNKDPHSHYLDVVLPEAIDGDLVLTFVRRNAQNDQVTRFDVESSIDGVNYTHAAYIDMPNSGAGKTETKEFALEQKAQYLRFWADTTTNNRGYWHCAEFQLCQKFTEVELLVDAPDYAYPTAVAALQEAIAKAQAVENGTKEDVEALAAAVEAYKAALAGYPEFTEWTGDVQLNAGDVTTIDDLLNVDFCFNRALTAEASGYGMLGVVFDHTGDAYALAFDALFGGVEVEQVKADGFIGNVAHVQFEKIDNLAEGLQAKAKSVAAKVGGFQVAEGHAAVVLASKSFLVDGEKYNALVKAEYELGTGTLTGIENLLVNSKGEIFDLQGRRVNNAQNGLFIQNGKKVIR